MNYFAHSYGGNELAAVPAADSKAQTTLGVIGTAACNYFSHMTYLFGDV
jgi:hypothetical protein